jgi:phenylacetic acid degradation operon negative regulatory protein
MEINAKQLILNLMMAAGTQAVQIKQLIYACELFGVKSGTVRVNITRLVSEEKLMMTERGFYILGEKASSFSDTISEWRHAFDQITPWTGDWIVVYCGELGRTDRKRITDRERALKLSGFRPLNRDTFIRPNNLQGSMSGIQSRLMRLGMEPGALFSVCSELSETENEITALWDTQSLNEQYQEMKEALTTWLKNCATMPAQEAAIASFLLGDTAIKMIAFDPLLPAEWVNAAQRDAFFETLIQFDEQGHALWQDILNQNPALTN